MDVLLQMKEISKSYGNNQVLHNVSLELKKGEIHSLVGENGAGKSTLMNILFGMDVIHKTGGFEGKVLIEGKKVALNSPKDAMMRGIGMVHQEFMLIPSFTIAENVKLNREISHMNPLSMVFGQRLNHLDFRAMNKDTKLALEELDMDLREYSLVEGLPIGHMQFIEIAREIDKHNIKLLVFDEPTAVLTESESDNLLKVMEKLSKKGIAILFISHRLEEVIRVSHRVTVLRDGELIACKEAKETSVSELAELMVGRNVEITQKKGVTKESDTYLELKNVHVKMPGEEVKGINLKVRKGEILGLAGLAGQGKIGISNGIMSLYPTQGQILYKGQDISRYNTKEILELGLAFVSEDRKGVGLVLDQSIEFNIAFTAMNIKGAFLKDLMICKLRDFKKIKNHAKKMIDDLDIRCHSRTQEVGRLSGGNQQKVCLAKALTLEPEILLISEPTRGIDIGAKKLILDLLLKLNQEKNMTIIITSSELAELRSIADRIAIISEGQVAGILSPSDSDKEFGLMMASRRGIKEAKIS